MRDCHATSVADGPTTLFFIACLWAGHGVAAERFHSDSRSSADYYLQTHGRVDPSRLAHAYAVFDNVLRVADKSGSASPELIVVNDRQQAAAFVLADGSVFVSQKALDIIRLGVEEAEADARLAFVLGHELAHLADNDFWDGQMDRALQGRALIGQVNSTAGQQKKELKADDQGFLYAALAGYRVEQCSSLHRRTGTSSASGSIISAGRTIRATSAADRTDLLRARLRERYQALQYFYFGVRLLHFGRYREGLGFLREFQQQFPSREVFSNLGYGYLQLAIGRLPLEYAYYYWLPTISDVHTPLERLTVRAAEQRRPRADWTIPAPVREDLLEAARYFESATTRDPAYGPGYVNLAVTQLLLGMDVGGPGAATLPQQHLLRAELAIASAQALIRDDRSIGVLAEIIKAEKSRTDKAAGKSIARGGAPVRTNIENVDPPDAYNLARLNADAPAIAARYWQQVVRQFGSLPPRIQTQVCLEQDGGDTAAMHDDLDRQCRAVTQNTPAPRPMPWSLPVQLSRDLLEKPFTTAEKQRFNWQQTELATGRVFTNASQSVLAIDDITTVVVLKNVAGTADTLLQCCGLPRERIEVTDGTLWLYGRWIAWVRQTKIQEIWAAN